MELGMRTQEDCGVKVTTVMRMEIRELIVILYGSLAKVGGCRVVTLSCRIQVPGRRQRGRMKGMSLVMVVVSLLSFGLQDFRRL